MLPHKVGLYSASELFHFARHLILVGLWNEVRYLDPAAMDILEAIIKFLIEFVGSSFDFF